MSQQALQEKLTTRLRQFARTSGGKVCADCTEKGPGQICLDFNTFVCMTCSGIHREFQHKCKGISMSKWTPTEVRNIEAGGNDKDRAIYLGKWREKDFPIPEAGDKARIRKFIELKYQEKRWYLDPAKAPQSGGLAADDHPKPEPISKILNEEPKLVVNRTTPPGRAPPTPQATPP
eukprot:CAMPEP_0206256802 /NCGR_PEP_ID=MMETSP0047_2-20121206/24984_1 /ASSEMBLY_ACC=CAM_ASM_000192 /TAXON_ID=195065 /ORGANISM="Chroomonas mesostigmatica_cf, Strain CCMP1168" /LENGTH=175 /DNA_ID=CAMNT_0053683311 /DNA_START=94 /DNA_END=617 /DNA_ORIENTATION=-